MRISRRYLFVAVPMSYIMSDYPPTNATPHAGSIPRLLIGFDRRKSPIRRSSCVLVSYPHLCNLIPCPHLLALFEHPICSQHQLKTEEAPPHFSEEFAILIDRFLLLLFQIHDLTRLREGCIRDERAVDLGRTPVLHSHPYSTL